MPYWAIMAAQCLGRNSCPPLSGFSGSGDEICSYNADIRFAVVENQEQTDKLLEIRDDCPKLETIIYEDTRGMNAYQQEFLHCFADVQHAGRSLTNKTKIFLKLRLHRSPNRHFNHSLYPGLRCAQRSGVIPGQSDPGISKFCDFDHLTSDEKCWPICRWPGSATMCFRSDSSCPRILCQLPENVTLF